MARSLADFFLLLALAAPILARLLNRYEVVLARDVDLDWKMDVTLMPASDPIVRFQPLMEQTAAIARGRLGGPVAKLVEI